MNHEEPKDSRRLDVSQGRDDEVRPRFKLLTILRTSEARLRARVYDYLSKTAQALRLERVSSRWLITMAVAAFSVCTTLAYRQFRQPYSWHEERNPFSELAWWIHPLEWNVDRGLVDIVGNIRAVALQPVAGSGSQRTWVVGDKGLLAFSDDDGHAWTQLQYDRSTGEFALGGSQQRNTASPVAGGPGNLLSALGTVYAAEVQQQEKGQDAAAEQRQNQQKPLTFAPNQINAPPRNIRSANQMNLSASKSLVDFGQHRVNSPSAPQATEIQNKATAEISIVTVQVSNTKEFRVASSDCTKHALPAGGGCSVQILFYPLQKGVRNASLQIISANKVLSDVAKLTSVELAEVATVPPAQDPGTPPRQTTSPTSQSDTSRAKVPTEPPDLVAIDFSPAQAPAIAASNGWMYSTRDDGRVGNELRSIFQNPLRASASGIGSSCPR